MSCPNGNHTGGKVTTEKGSLPLVIHLAHSSVTLGFSSLSFLAKEVSQPVIKVNKSYSHSLQMAYCPRIFFFFPI